MSETSLLLLFFVFTIAAVCSAGYFVLYRREGATEPASTREALADTFRSLGEVIPAKSGDSLRTMLIAAGFRSPNAVSIYNGIRFAGAAVLGCICLAVGAIWRDSVSTGIILGMCVAAFTVLLAKRVLDRLIRARAQRLNGGLPTALDMLTLSVEAGQSIDQAIYDTSREIRRAFPDLAGEFTQMYLSLRANTSRAEVFREMGDRNRDSELRKIAALLIDSDRFGSTLGPALRTHAKYLRIRRRQMAQESARKVTTKLVFPVFFLIFPAVLLVTLGPAVIQLMNSFENMAVFK